MAGTSTLSDDFAGASLDSAKWPTAYGTSVTLTGGRLRISCDTTYAGVQSGSVYTLDSFSVEPFPPALNSAPADCYGTVMAQSAAQPAGTTAGFFIDRISGLLYCVVWSGYFDAGAVSVTYNATNHAWLHFTYNGSTFVWQSSATQTGTRTTLRTMSSSLPAWRNNSDFSIYFDTHRDGGTSNFYEIGAINPSTVRTTSGTAAATATATAIRTTTRTKTGSAAAAATARATSAKVRPTTGIGSAAATATATRSTNRGTIGQGIGVATASSSISTTRMRTGVGSATATATASSSTVRTKTGTGAAAATAVGASAKLRSTSGTGAATATAVSASAALKPTARTAAATAGIMAASGTTRATSGTGSAAATASASTGSHEQHVTDGTAAATAAANATTAKLVAGIATVGVTVNGSAAIVTVRPVAGTAAATAGASAETAGGDPFTTQSLFTTQEPVVTDAVDGEAAYSMGTYFMPAVDGTVTHIRWMFPLSAQPTHVPGGNRVKANLFRNSDSEKLGGPDALFDTPGDPGEWNQVALSTPVDVTAGTMYCATIWTPNRYVASVGEASPWPLTNGDLSADASAGRFTGGGSGNVEFPTSSFNNGCYFVDVVLAVGEVPEIHTTTGTGSAAAAATAVTASQRLTSGTAAAAVAAAAATVTRHTTAGTGRVVATAMATTGASEQHASSGTGSVAATASSIHTTRRTTAGTGSAAATAGYLPPGTSGRAPIESTTRPGRLISRGRAGRIASVTRPARVG